MESFADVFPRLDRKGWRRAMDETSTDDVRRVLAKGRWTVADASTLFSKAAAECLEETARLAAALTERRFGKVIQLYVPLYLSNECANICRYCGFSMDLDIPRVSLGVDEAVREAEHLYAEGFRHVLLLSGEYRGRYNVQSIAEVARRLRGRFASLAIEVFPMEREEYASLEAQGVDGLVLYQETYDPEVYRRLHTKGPKSRFDNRLRAVEKGGEAGFRSLGVGALLGLADWRLEACTVAAHAAYLSRRFWKSRIAVSFPRVNEAEADFDVDYPMSDAELVQMIVGMRLLLPDAELVVSTREPARLRDHIVGLGVTRMSAGSKTNPGGYATHENSGKQFDISDERSAAQVAQMITDRGFEPVWKDFDAVFTQPR